jgi:hyperosmotically inducible protein
MKMLIATLFATAAGAAFAAPTFALNHDPASYRAVTQKAAAEYKTAAAKCGSMSGNDKDVCMAEAKLARTRTEADALSQYNNTPKSREKARSNLADAEYDLAKAKCDAKSGADKDDCMNNAKSVHTAALADAKSGGSATGASAAGTTAAGAGGGLVASTDTRDPAKAAAVDKCAQGGDGKTACLIQTKQSSVKQNTGELANRTEQAASTATEKTKDAAATATEKSKEVGAKTKIVAADTAITTKVKAGLVKEPDLESLGIHVETEKGVVMLSGFVNSKAEADKAVQVAKGVDGVTSVKSAIKVK